MSNLEDKWEIIVKARGKKIKRKASEAEVLEQEARRGDQGRT